MTHAKSILFAVNEFRKQGIESFSRKDIRDSLGVNHENWTAGFSPVFQSMRVDQPGGAPAVAEQYRNVFKRINRGTYVLTEYGISLVEEMFDQNAVASPKIGTAVILDYSDSNQTNTNPDFENIYSAKLQQFLDNAETYHETFYQYEIFGNPSLYFHHKALDTRKSPNSVEHLEYVYAAMVAWGMNRPGIGGPKMQYFETFRKSVQLLNSYISTAQTYDLLSMDEEKWKTLEKIFKGIKIMASQTSLVGNSKVMHHMLPEVIPPIDRQYTLTYLRGNTNIRNDLDSEWFLMKKIISGFFLPIATNDDFIKLSNSWMNKLSEFQWDTSVLKIIDNVIIGAVKSTN